MFGPKTATTRPVSPTAKANLFLVGGLPRFPRQVPCIATPVVCPRSHELFVIHFYSGTRRNGDMQSWLEQAGGPSGAILTALSVDILFHDVLGDLSLAKTQNVGWPLSRTLT